jgi:magnesium transporter
MAETFELKNVQNQLSSISESLSDGTFVQVRKLLHDLQPGDVALLLESSPSKTRNEL